MKPPPPQSSPLKGPVTLDEAHSDSTSVALRFFGDDLDPVELSNKLGAEPTVSHRKGDSMPNIAEKTRATGSWLLSGEPMSKTSLDEQINKLFDQLTDDLEVWRELTDRYRSDLFCGVWSKAWNRGVSLSPDVVARISERGLSIGFDVYFVPAE